MLCLQDKFHVFILEGYGRPFDAHHRSDPFYQRDPFLEKPRDSFRPAVFDYDHARKFEVYDYDSWKMPPDDPSNSGSVRATSPLPSNVSSGKDALERSNSADRRRSSPSTRARSPRPSQSPRRGSSPRRSDQNRPSRNRQRRSRSRSSSRKSASPSRRSSRRSPSPKRRRPSPPRNRRHSREDSRSRDRNDRKDRSSESDRRRLESSTSHRNSGRIPPDRQPREEAHYHRYPETVVPEPAPPEPGPEILPIQDLLDPPGRNSRPSQVS